MSYTIYEWKIQPKSSFLTKLQSDTIWGHILWAIRYIEGEEAVKKALKGYEDGSAPYIVSNGFLSGYLPFVRSSHIGDIFNSGVLKATNKYCRDEKKKANRILNAFNDIEYVAIDTFQEMRQSKSLLAFYQDVIQERRCPVTLRKYKLNTKGRLDQYLNDRQSYIKEYQIKTYHSLIQTVRIARNKINRLTGTSEQEEGAGVFHTYETFYHHPISIYIKLHHEVNVQKFEKYLQYVEKTGFGKKASSGKGHFETLHFQEKKDLFQNIYSGNGYITLSNYIPKKGDFVAVVSANLLTKRGKVSGLYANRDHVFKKPFICYGEGSVFKGAADDQKGVLLRGLYYDKQVVQCGIPFIVGVNLSE